MSEIQRFFTETVTRARLVSLSSKEEYGTTTISISCHIQTWDGSLSGPDSARFPTHTLWCNLSSDILSGDRLVASTAEGTIKYDVIMTERAGFGRNTHLKASLAKVTRLLNE